MNLDDLFSPLQFGSIRRSGFTLLHEDDEAESARKQQTSRVARLRPMEISAFRVEISWDTMSWNELKLSLIIGKIAFWSIGKGSSQKATNDKEKIPNNQNKTWMVDKVTRNTKFILNVLNGLKMLKKMKPVEGTWTVCLCYAHKNLTTKKRQDRKTL